MTLKSPWHKGLRLNRDFVLNPNVTEAKNSQPRQCLDQASASGANARKIDTIPFSSQPRVITGARAPASFGTIATITVTPEMPLYDAAAAVDAIYRPAETLAAGCEDDRRRA